MKGFEGFLVDSVCCLFLRIYGFYTHLFGGGVQFLSEKELKFTSEPMAPSSAWHAFVVKFVNDDLKKISIREACMVPPAKY